MASEEMYGYKRCWCGGRAVLNSWELDSETWGCVDSKFHDPFADGRPKEIKRLYVAGPMTGYADCNYPEFNRVSEILRQAGYEVVNPAEVHIDEQHHYVDLIREDLRVMLDCQGVATIENWWESTGARNEVHVAGILKMPVRTVAEWAARKLFPPVQLPEGASSGHQ